jgi:hypothetical protein
MGRELKRVPLGFDWPINERWKGYLSPEEFHFPTCRECDGEGYGPEARAIANTFYRHQIGGPNAAALAWHDKIGQKEVDNLLKEGRLGSWVDGQLQFLPLTAAEVNRAQHERGFGYMHDGINHWILVRFRCEVLGITLECPVCSGHGHIATDAQREAADAWERQEPPSGDGYQIWETVTEGSPISPVFATPEELARHMATTRWGADKGTPYETWLKFITGPGWAPTLIGDAVNGVRIGVEGMADRVRGDES